MVREENPAGGNLSSPIHGERLLGNGVVAIPTASTDKSHVFNNYVIRTERRDALKQFLADQGIQSEIYYPVPLHLQKCFADLGYRPGDFPAGRTGREPGFGAAALSRIDCRSDRNPSSTRFKLSTGAKRAFISHGPVVKIFQLQRGKAYGQSANANKPKRNARGRQVELR